MTRKLRLFLDYIFGVITLKDIFCKYKRIASCFNLSSLSLMVFNVKIEIFQRTCNIFVNDVVVRFYH